MELEPRFIRALAPARSFGSLQVWFHSTASHQLIVSNFINWREQLQTSKRKIWKSYWQYHMRGELQPKQESILQNYYFFLSMTMSVQPIWRHFHCALCVTWKLCELIFGAIPQGSSPPLLELLRSHYLPCQLLFSALTEVKCPLRPCQMCRQGWLNTVFPLRRIQI